MTMNGIDVSHWQSTLNLASINCDFVIIKVTEGMTVIDPMADTFFKQASKLGKKIGFYHFAHPENNSAAKEAKFFYKQAKQMFGHGIPILDWESIGRANIKWAKEWLDEIYRLTGVKPLIYMSESVVNNHNWKEVAEADYGLWVAKYRDTAIHYNYDMTDAGKKPVVKHWSVIAMWQWTAQGKLTGYSGTLDCDVFYGNPETWDKYAGIQSVTEIAKEVIDGKWGNGLIRTIRLKLAGYDYQAIRNKVNELLRKKK